MNVTRPVLLIRSRHVFGRQNIRISLIIILDREEKSCPNYDAKVNQLQKDIRVTFS